MPATAVALPSADELALVDDLLTYAIGELDMLASRVAALNEVNELPDVDPAVLNEAAAGRMLLFARELRSRASLLEKYAREIEGATGEAYHRAQELTYDPQEYAARQARAAQSVLEMADRWQRPRAEEGDSDA